MTGRDQIPALGLLLLFAGCTGDAVNRFGGDPCEACAARDAESDGAPDDPLQEPDRAHADAFRFYEIGFRCCADPTSE